MTALDHATARGWTLDQLLSPIAADGVDEAQALVWRTTMLTNPIHEDHIDALWVPEPERPRAAGADTPADEVEVVDDAWAILQIEAMIRAEPGEPELTPAELTGQLNRRDAWREAAVTPERLAHVNQLTTQFYESRFTDSWAHDYLAGRLHTDLAGDPGYRPGYAPAGWTSLVSRLRREGVTDREMVLAGVAKVASTGNLIDRFRNRLVFPITHDDQVLGFIARRHPDADDTAGPKYLNTPETPLFHKGAQLYGHAPSLLRGARPVLVEGPLDAIAVTLATHGQYAGVAALGTALTREQARELRRYTDLPIVATDNDEAGRAAAERHYWTLTDLGHDPLHANLPEGADPADLVAHSRHDDLANAVRTSVPLTRAMLARAISDYTRTGSIEDAIRVIGATSPARWSRSLYELAEATGQPVAQLQAALAATLGADQASPHPRGPAAPRAVRRPTPAPDPSGVGGPEPIGRTSGPQR